MKRRGFFLNSVVLLLLIPLLLLLATYEDVSSQVIQAQTIRTQAERTYRVASYLELDFQKALEISGKRAIVAVIDYVSGTGNFISPTYMVNNTIRDLILEGTSPSLAGYDPNRVMRDQSLRKWLMNITEELNKQGFEVFPSINDILSSMELTVAPLDSFRIVIKARIPNITIQDVSGRIVYTGSIPSNGGYIYSIVNLQNLEDPLFSAMTGGRYYRSIRACPYSFPEILEKPIKVLEGNGSSTVSHVIGLLSRTVDAEKIFFGDYYPGEGAKAYVLLNEPDQNVTVPIVVNTTLNGVRTSPLSVFNENDMGVLVFENVGDGGNTNWCYPSLEYRVNLTLSGGSLSNYNGYQIPIVITDTSILGKIYSIGNNASIRIVEKGTCNEVPFWIEYWSSTKAIVWIKATASMEYTMYFGSDPAYATRGNGNKVFEWFHDTEEIIPDGNEKQFDLSSLNINGNIAIRFRAKPSKRSTNQQWDSGIYVETTDSNGNPQWVYFIDDTVDISNSLEVWDEYYILWWWFWIRVQGTSTNDGARGDTGLHTYEAVIEPDLNGAYVDFLDYGTDYSNYPNPARENPDGLLRHYTAPLEYLYMVNFNNNNNNDAVFEWIFIRKYVQNLPVETFQNIETRPSSTVTTTRAWSGARAYDIQSFINCIMDQRYFGIYNAPSFFERLEGSTINHDEYETLAHQIQDELGIKYGDQYYPIGLVSFMIPHATYDEKLFNLFNTLGITPEEGQTSFDYYFLQYYFGGGSKVSGYRVYGISDSPDRSSVYFFLDNQTAVAIFGAQGAQDLLQR
ncbi:DUF2341 domain-containing protein [Thermococcus sp. M39]|uniref:DUF2341 domain-containing protein n=2 Tax=Thermococcus TaxID=2263 RepID=UPI0016A0DF56|nr:MULTISPECIES: DUF2341 domain-containing protein [unclassified Thermococcus]NJE08958.1 DUF2341 domain-containing protein [Thermococcus sp. M39]NJE12768.1 DUF2341 domain-containing protein [Thermococcus sp. LS2]